MYNQNSDLMKQEKFMLPTMIEGDFSAEELAEDADGLQMSFQRVKIPAGGTLQFEMPSDDPDNPDYEKNLVGVILHNHATCAYWPAGSEYDDDTTPLCSSVDGKVGIGTPGGACAACVMNRFGSAPDGSKGKACKNMRVLYLLRSGEYMPLQVNLPPTSIKPFKEFLNRAFMLRRRATYGSIVQIGLKRENNGTNDYSVATFKLLQDFQGEELAQIRAYANSFKEQIKLLLQQRAEITEEQRDTGCDYVIEPGAMTNEPADGHYTVSQINRYVTAVANRGTVYSLSLIDKTTDSNGKLIKDYTPEIVNQMDEISSSTWDLVHNGMESMVKSSSTFAGMDISMGGKTGTAQYSKIHADNVLFVGYAPADSPEISIAVRIANGYASTYAAEIGRDITKVYFNPESADELLQGYASSLGTAEAGD